MFAQGCFHTWLRHIMTDLRPDLRRNAAILGRPHELSFSSDVLRPGFFSPGIGGACGPGVLEKMRQRWSDVPPYHDFVSFRHLTHFKCREAKEINRNRSVQTTVPFVVPVYVHRGVALRVPERRSVQWASIACPRAGLANDMRSIASQKGSLVPCRLE